MQTIYKYPVNMTQSFYYLQLPKNAIPLSVHEQNNQICLWAQVDPSQPIVNIPIHVVPTGGTLPEYGDTKFIGTVHVDQFVFHIFIGIIQEY